MLFDQWDFKLISFKEGEQVAATFAGPSCDSLDIMFRGKMTVRQEEGDLILVPICGLIRRHRQQLLTASARPILLYGKM